jgi:hypothetical protein
MDVDGGQRLVRQTRQYFSYQPGKSLEILLTGTLAVGGGKEDVVSRIGYFDDVGDKVNGTLSGDGFFFELNGNELFVVRRSYISGSQVDTKIPQSLWNIDTMDGEGPSKISFDPSKRCIFFIDQEWLGVGDVTMGFVINRTVYACHSWSHSNQQNNGDDAQYPYTCRASLPVRYEINSTGTNSATMNQICCTVTSNGGFQPTGKFVFAADRGNVHVDVGDAELPLLSIRLKPSHIRTSLLPMNISLTTTTTADIKYSVYRFIAPSESPLTNDSWVSASDYSAAEYDVSANVVDLSGTTYPYIKAFTGYFSDRINQDFADLNENLLCVANIAGNSDIITITAQSVGIGSSEDTFASMQWKEIF